tara:strand:+ start:429 stop:1415 length:987 start_codon:yes stop_codon:yes gene_type:complete
MRIGSGLSVLLPIAILLGLGTGHFLPKIGSVIGAVIDPLVLTLLFLMFFEVRFSPLRKASDHLSFLSLAWVSNFILIPVLGWGLASLFFDSQTALFAGLLLYFLFPCTDWFLAFTRIAKGDVALGSVLIPINLISQLLLFPVYLSIFLGSQISLDLKETSGTFVQWFLFPLIAAVSFRFLLSKVLSTERFKPIPPFIGSLVPWVLSLLVFSIFVCHTTQLIENPSILLPVLLAVLMFFVLTWLMGEFFAKYFRLARPQHVLLSITTTARNSPLMLSLATIALPDQPLVYAVLILGMLVEFPHLTILSRLMLGKDRSVSPSGGYPVTPA